jgi:ankyrin repeat protein
MGVCVMKGKETPLHIAARTKDGEKCAEMLIKSGADVNATKEVPVLLVLVHYCIN